MTGIQILQVILSAALLIALWRFLNPIIADFVDVIAKRQERTDRTETEVFGERLELRELSAELAEKRQGQRARGVKSREEIVEVAKDKMLSATQDARQEAVAEINLFRQELVDLRNKVTRDIDSEAEALSKIIIEKVSAGSGLDSQTIH